jgi:SulP family sulfate permease
MGGCAMIGQTMINLGSGGRTRLGRGGRGNDLLFILFLSPLIERIPLAALVGVMFVVSQQTLPGARCRCWARCRVTTLLIVAVTAIPWRPIWRRQCCAGL